MADNNKIPGTGSGKDVATVIDIILKVGTLLLLLYFCFRILKPFLGMLVWGIIIAIVAFPFFERLRALLGKRNRLSSFLITLLALSMVVLPSIWLVEELLSGIKFLSSFSQEGSLYIPPPHASVADWPLVGSWLHENWLAASENLGESVKNFMPQIVSWSQKLLEKLASTGI